MHHRGGVHPYRYVQGRRWRFYSSLLRTVRRRHACSRHVVPYEGTRARARARSLSPVSCFFFLRFAAAQNFPAHVWRHHIIAFANRFRSKSSRTRVCYYTYFILYTRWKKKKKKPTNQKWSDDKSKNFRRHVHLMYTRVFRPPLFIIIIIVIITVSRCVRDEGWRSEGPAVFSTKLQPTVKSKYRIIHSMPRFTIMADIYDKLNLYLFPYIIPVFIIYLSEQYNFCSAI